MGMKVVMAFGTFDIFHLGHQSYLKQAKKLGDYLIVVVARDKTVFGIKKQQTENGEQERLKVIKNSDLADESMLGNLKDKYWVIKKFRPDIIALGYDQKVNLRELKEKLTEFNLKTKIIRLKSHKPKFYKSSKLKRRNKMKNEEIMKDDFKILRITKNFPPTHEEIKLATRKKGGQREQCWIKTAIVPTPDGTMDMTFINKKNK